MGEEMKNSVEITVAGTVMTLRTDEDPEYVKKLAERLDGRVMELTLNHGRCSKTEALILSAIEALDAAIKLKGKLKDLKGSGDGES